MALICENCGIKANMPQFNGKIQLPVVLSNHNSLMLCNLCIKKAEKIDKKRGNSQQERLF